MEGIGSNWGREVSGYASQTSVSAEKSRTEIERTLKRFGADAFVYGWDQEKAMVQFRAEGKVVKFLLPMPNRNTPHIKYTPVKGTLRSPQAFDVAFEKAIRANWRALLLIIKAKLVAVDAGIVTFEEEFLAQIMLPSGETVGDWIVPQVELAYEAGDMPMALPIGGGE